MAEERAELQPVLDGGGLIGSIKRATFGLGQMLEATQRWADETEAQMGRVAKAAREAKAAAESTVALQGAAATNQAGATSGGPSTPDGGRGVQTDPLSKMKDQILQGIGRK